MSEISDLEALSVSVRADLRKSVHWCTFLLVAMIVVLVIDLQLKKSIARQAVAAAAGYNAMTDRLVADVKAGSSGRSGTVGASADDGDHPVRGGGGDVDGGAGVAAGDDPPFGGSEAAAVRGSGGRPKRAPGDGRRAVRPEG